MIIIQELIDGMLHGDFYKAREEASQIADPALLGQIQAILEQSKNDAEKMYCYWILKDLGRNSGSIQVADYLMERVALEKKTRLRGQALKSLLFLHGVSDATNAIAALRDKNRDVRRYAIHALGACSDPQAEEALIGIVNSDDDPAATREAALILARIATPRCVDSMVALFRRLPRDRMYDITVTAALLALARVGAAQSLPLAVEELGASRSAFVNLACMLVIEQHGNQAQIETVINRLTAYLKKKNRQEMQYIVPLVETKYPDELTAGLSFLLKFADAQVDDFLAFLRANSARLFEREQSFLEDSLKRRA